MVLLNGRVLNEDFISYFKIKNEHYKPAIDYSIQLATNLINSQIANPLTFSLSSFEKATDLFDQLSIIFLDKLRTDCLNDDNLSQDQINTHINKFNAFLYSNPQIFDLFNSIDQSTLDKESKAAYRTHLRKFLESNMLLKSDDKIDLLIALNIA